MKTTDMLGQEYGVGDFVVYATTSGRSPVQKYAVVERVEVVDVLDYDDEPTGKTRLRVGVRELANGRGFTRYDTYGPDGSTFTSLDGHVIERVVPGVKTARVTYPMPANIIRVGVSA